MKRITKILSFICLVGMIFGALRVSRLLPADASDYVEKKYSGWSGVLRGWVYSDWSCAGGFVRWLNSCAAAFEKAHEGVYIEFEAVSREAINALDSLHPPEMILFSIGALDSGAQLLPITGEKLRGNLESAGDGWALPVAMGGYIRVENPDAAGTAVSPEHCAPLIAMLGAQEGEPLPESGLDLGLPAMNQYSAVEIDPDAFQRFINGELGATIIDQSQLARLISLRDAGRGPNWQCVASGRYAWADQLLMLGVVESSDAQQALCREFAQLLLSEECQAALADIGAFPVTAVSAYDDFSAYRPMESQIQASALLLPKDEHSLSAAEGFVRELNAGGLRPSDAASKLAQTCG